ncbi:GldM family protein [Taibaiella chishuiensis]|uniref:GldM-like protein n=1 Tax=Taibaiella chishuiensis TaxID=1434707 RepID=A0A2P8D0X3_9BACT|nr:GldM family protein [Taibaiella chishuiensis]PSK90872.1 GldM-like protein [Taibaiella chishuiensis]
MRLILSLLIIVFYATNAKAKHTFISCCSKRQVAYVGLENTVEFGVDNSSCSKYQLVSKDLEFKPTESSCIFTITPDRPGKFIVWLKDKKTNKTVYETKFNVLKLPPPEIRFASQTNGELHKAHAKAQIGLIASLDGFDISVRFEVAKFLIIIIRNGEVVFSRKNIGAMFSPEVKNGLKDIQPGDKLIFVDANYNGPSGHSGNLKPAEFTIIE